MGVLTWLVLLFGGFFLLFIIGSLVFGGTIGNGVSNGFSFGFDSITSLFNFRF